MVGNAFRLKRKDHKFKANLDYKPRPVSKKLGQQRKSIYTTQREIDNLRFSCDLLC